MAARSITIIDQRDEDGHFTVDALYSDGGAFRLDGHDVGSAVGESDRNDPWQLDRTISESAVPNSFWSRVGD